MIRTIAAQTIAILLFASTLLPYPANGIVEDQEGNIYFADAGLDVVWKITAENDMMQYVQHVHCHDIWLDSLGALHGEDQAYDEEDGGSAWGYWVKWQDDYFRWQQDVTRDARRPVVYDQQGNGYLWRGDFTKQDSSSLWMLTLAGDWRKLCGGEYGFKDGDSAHALMSGVTDMFVSDSGALYLVDLRSIRVWKDGQLRTLYREKKNEGPLQNLLQADLNYVFGIHVLPDGSVLLANYGNRNLVKWTLGDKVATEVYRSDEGWAPVGVTVRRNGNILVLENRTLTDESLQLRVYELLPDGTKRLVGGT